MRSQKSVDNANNMFEKARGITKHQIITSQPFPYKHYVLIHDKFGFKNVTFFRVLKKIRRLYSQWKIMKVNVNKNIFSEN